ncbi:MAG: hypothetical protein F9K48_10375, partial [Candidatus Brocadia sp.]
GSDGGKWVEKEFGGGARLGDKRLRLRLVEIAGDKAGQPGRTYCKCSRRRLATGQGVLPVY